MSSDERKLTRRDLLATTGGAAAGLVLAAGCAPTAATSQREEREMNAATRRGSDRMPVVYVPHGGGPWPFVDIGFGDPAEWEGLRRYLTELSAVTAERPRALLVISAHWEERVPTVMSAPRPPMLYDYYGFPQASYEITWPAPGEPVLAARVRELLSSAGIESAEDASRGFDHGTFVPLKLTYPEADIPCVQLSLQRGLDPAQHLAIGRALMPLREEGVLLVGSGMSYHNMRGFGSPGGRAASIPFDEWLRETIGLDAAERDARRARWQDAPSARACHPREEHLLPLMVIAGAAGADRGRVPYSDTLRGTRVSAAHFG
jgi:aromatic ring-opening dioxygenase catalytic subunit (LigB family)